MNVYVFVYVYIYCIESKYVYLYIDISTYTYVYMLNTIKCTYISLKSRCMYVLYMYMNIQHAGMLFDAGHPRCTMVFTH